ncbi:hypothetical protein [Nocardia brasiliensis]
MTTPESKFEKPANTRHAAESSNVQSLQQYPGPQQSNGNAVIHCISDFRNIIGPRSECSAYDDSPGQVADREFPLQRFDGERPFSDIAEPGGLLIDNEYFSANIAKVRLQIWRRAATSPLPRAVHGARAPYEQGPPTEQATGEHHRSAQWDRRSLPSN